MKKIAVARTIVAEAQARNAETKRKIEAGEPCVGIFWVLPGDIVVGDITPVSEADNYNGMLNGFNDHYKFWSTIQRAYKSMPDVAGHPYEYWPRGRVMKDSNTGEYHVLADKQIIHNSIRLRKVCREFSIPFRQVVPNLDDHYKAPGNLGGELAAPETQQVQINRFVNGEFFNSKKFPTEDSAIAYLKNYYGRDLSPQELTSLQNGQQTTMDDEQLVMTKAA